MCSLQDNCAHSVCGAAGEGKGTTCPPTLARYFAGQHIQVIRQFWQYLSHCLLIHLSLIVPNQD